MIKEMGVSRVKSSFRASFYEWADRDGIHQERQSPGSCRLAGGHDMLSLETLDLQFSGRWATDTKKIRERER